jgi:hypothetical protein
LLTCLASFLPSRRPLLCCRIPHRSPPVTLATPFRLASCLKIRVPTVFVRHYPARSVFPPHQDV